MALLNCPECNGRFSDDAKSCPHCGAPLQKTESITVHVWFNGSWMENETELEALQAEGWVVVEQNVHNEWVDGFDVDVTSYNLQRTGPRS